MPKQVVQIGFVLKSTSFINIIAIPHLMQDNPSVDKVLWFRTILLTEGIAMLFMRIWMRVYTKSCPGSVAWIGAKVRCRSHHEALSRLRLGFKSSKCQVYAWKSRPGRSYIDAEVKFRFTHGPVAQPGRASVAAKRGWMKLLIRWSRVRISSGPFKLTRKKEKSLGSLEKYEKDEIQGW